MRIPRKVQAALCALAIGTALVSWTDSASAADPGVTPADVTLDLSPGESTTITKTVSTPAIPPKPDIVFLIDTTGSMGGVIENVQTNANTILGNVASAQPDAQFAVAEYRDVAVDPTSFRVAQNLTGNQTDVTNGLNSLVASGGGDIAEDGINALFQVSTGAITFRPGSTRIVLLIGDAPSHNPSNGHSLDSTIGALQAADIAVLALDLAGLDSTGQATAITNATGGELFSGIDPSEVSATILAALGNLPVTVTHQLSDCDPGLNVTLTPASRTVTSGEDATFTETVSVSAGAVPGSTLTCSVNFLINGTLAAGFTQSITVNVPKATPSISTTPSGSVPAGGNISDSATVSGGFAPTGTVTFQLFGPGDTTCQTPIATRTGTLSGGTASSGNVAAGGAGIYRWVATYTGDASNNPVTSPCGAELVTVTKATPSITTTPSGTVPAGGNVSDSATVSGGFAPTGSVTFQLFGPGDTTCQTPIATRTGTLSGGTASSGNVAAGGVGTYNWVATYTGDANNNAVTSPCGSEQVEVIKATPSITTTPSGTVPAGGIVSDSATVSGGFAPTGSVTFQLFAPGDTTCQTPIATRTGTLSGGTASSGNVTIGAAGTYRWVATYTGDANNNAVTSPCDSEQVVVTPQVLTGRAYGLTAQASLLGVELVDVAPVPDTGDISTTSTSTTSVPCTATLSGLVGARVLCAQVATTEFPGRSVATASVDETTVGIPGLPVITLQAIKSTSTTTCAGSTGSTTIAFLKVGNTVVIGQPTTIAPNTTVNVGAVKLVLNEQIPFSTPDAGLTVNAVHITVNALGLARTNVVVASSESDIGNCP